MTAPARLAQPINTLGKSVVNVLAYGATGKVADSGQEFNDAVQAALADAKKQGFPRHLFFPHVPSDGTEATVYNITEPLRCEQGNFTVEFGDPNGVALRGNFMGPQVVAQSAVALPLEEALVPAYDGSNPTPYAWNLDDGTGTGVGHYRPFVSPGRQGGMKVDGFSALTIQFTLQLDADVTGGDVRAVGPCSGGSVCSAEATTGFASAFQFYLIGGGYFGTDNQLGVYLTTTTGLHIVYASTGLSTGVTYHVELSYDGATLRVFVSPLDSPTGGVLVASQSVSGNVVQKPYELVTIGRVPYNAWGSEFIYGPARARIAAIRVDSAALHTAAGFDVPQTAWNTTAFDTTTTFVCNFDVFKGPCGGSEAMGVVGDVVGAWCGGGGSILPMYMPTEGPATWDGKSGITLINVNAGGGLPSTSPSAGFWFYGVVGAELRNCVGGGYYGVTALNNCFFSKFDVLATASGPYAFADIGAGNSNRYRVRTRGGAYAGGVLVGGSPINVDDWYAETWGDGYALIVDQEAATFRCLTTSSEERTTACEGSLLVGGLAGVVSLVGGALTAFWNASGVHGAPPLHVAGVGPFTLVGTELDLQAGASEYIHNRTGAAAVVNLLGCARTTSAVPWTTDTAMTVNDTGCLP